jgi:glycosyltransferase involved in cell wall biosynthesis
VTRKLFKLAAILLLGFFLGGVLNLPKWPQRKEKKPCFPVTEHKAFVFVIPSYNNSRWVEKNLRSIFEQRYDNFRIIYIDDASTDETLQLAQALTKLYGQEHRVQIWHNETNRGAVENIYRAVHSCQDHEIVITCDGDDWIAHEKVLQKLNEKYADPSVWATYGSYIEHPSYSYTLGNFARPLPKNVVENHAIRTFTKKHWYLSHMRTFYASLFKKIQLKDLLHEGRYFDAAYDVAFMLPIAEMAEGHLHFIDEIFYIYNRASPINDDKVRPNKQQEITQHILALAPYAPLACCFTKSEQQKVHLIAFSYDRPLQLYALLESLKVYARGVETISVLYRTSSEEYARGYEEVQRSFPHICFTLQTGDFKSLLLQMLEKVDTPYLACAVDDIVLTDTVDFSYGAQMLEKTGAYSFLYRLGTNIDYCYMLDQEQGVPPLAQVDEDVFAWVFDLGKGDWNYQNSVDLCLYRKKDLVSLWETLSFNHPNALETEWYLKSKKNRIGLCHFSAKMVNIPLNCVNLSQNRQLNRYSAQELLEKFKKGLKMNIAPLYQLQNRSAHAEVDVEFIDRVVQGEG